MDTADRKVSNNDSKYKYGKYEKEKREASPPNNDLKYKYGRYAGGKREAEAEAEASPLNNDLKYEYGKYEERSWCSTDAEAEANPSYCGLE